MISRFTGPLYFHKYSMAKLRTIFGLAVALALLVVLLRRPPAPSAGAPRALGASDGSEFAARAVAPFVRLYLHRNASQQRVEAVERQLLAGRPLNTSSDAALQRVAATHPLLAQLIRRYQYVHRDIMEHHASGVLPKRYVVLELDPLAGLGNRFQVLVATFLFALLSNRAMLLHWPSVYGLHHWNKEEQVGMPAVDQLLQLPDFQWNLARHNASHRALHCTQRNETFVGDDSWTHCCDVGGTQCRRTKRLRGVEAALQCQFLGGDRVAAQSGLDRADDQDTQLLQQDVVRVHTWDYFAPSLAVNGHYRALFDALRGADDAPLFAALARYLIRPLPKVQARIDRFVAQRFAKLTVGLQIRRVGINKLSEEQERVFWKTALDIVEQYGLPGDDDVRFFLATDSAEVRQRAVSHLGDRVIYWDQPISRRDARGVTNGLIDLWLLASCNETVVSAASTYGKVAGALASRRGHVVNAHNRLVRLRNSEPCFFQFERHCVTTVPRTMLEQVEDCHYR